MSETNFDPNVYTRGLSFSLSTGILLARTLASLTPKAAPANAKKAGKKLLVVADAAQEAQKTRQRELGVTVEELDKVIDQEADGSWSALRDRVLALADLPGKLSKRPERARKLLQKLFGDGGLR